MVSSDTDDVRKWAALFAIPAISGDARLVPPTVHQGPLPQADAEQRTQNPEAGSASAETSGTPRWPPTRLETTFW